MSLSILDRDGWAGDLCTVSGLRELQQAAMDMPATYDFLATGHTEDPEPILPEIGWDHRFTKLYEILRGGNPPFTITDGVADDAEEDSAEVANIGDLPGHDFRGNQFTGGIPGGHTSAIFSSPNVRKGTTFNYAEKELSGERQKQMRLFADDVDSKLGLKPVHYHDAIGEWSDGAENTVVTTYKAVPSFDVLRTAAALRGLAGNQKAVIPFITIRDGEDYLHDFTLPMPAREAGELLKKRGVEHHTLIPTQSGTRIMVYDQGGESAKLVRTIIHEYKAPHATTRGRGEFLGSEHDDREEACARYREQISRYEVAARSRGLHLSEGGSSDHIRSLLEQAERKLPRLDYGALVQRTRGDQSRELKVPGQQENGAVPLTHYSQRASLSALDPLQHGTGLLGKESERKKLYPETFVPRTYFYLEGGKKESGLVKNHYSPSVPAASLYDMDLDPYGIAAKAGKEALAKEGVAAYGAAENLAEKRVKEAGYLGYYSRTHKVAALFHKIPSSGLADWKSPENN